MKERLLSHQKQIVYILTAGLGLCFLITRFLYLDRLPLGMHLDEAGMAYDALSLANYGVDRYLKPWPLYLINYNAGQSSLYAFLCAGLFKLFGYNIWLVRLPAVFFSFLTLVFGMKLTKRIYPDRVFLPLLTGCLVTFCPYFVLSSRFGLDCNLMLGASAVFLYFMHTAVETGETGRYVAAGLSGGILLYTYALSYAILPIFLLLSALYVVVVKKFSLKKWICMGIPMGILAFPLILVQIVNIFDLPETRLGPFTITRVPHYRASEIGRFRPEYFLSALQHIFVGDNDLFSSIPRIWNLYAVTVILCVIGLISVAVLLVVNGRKRRFYPMAFPFLWFVTVLFFESHIISKTYTLNSIFLATALLAIAGLHTLSVYGRRFYPALLLGICGIYALCSLRFGIFYFGGRYTENTHPLAYFGLTFPEAVEFIEEHEGLSQKLTFVSERGIFYALSAQISPYEFDITGDECIHWHNYWFGSLQEITDDCNYLVGHYYEEYSEELRQAGFSELRGDTWSLFYKE